MRTTDLFKFNRSSKRINESFEKTFGKKLKLETFSIEQLEDARNKLRTQIHTVRSESNFNETVENDTLTQAQFMHDAIVAELAERDEPIVDNTDVEEGVMSEIDDFYNEWMNSEYAPMDDESGDENAVMDKAMQFLRGQVPEEKIEDYAMAMTDAFHGGGNDDEGGETDDGYALASAGFGSDEDYESVSFEEKFDPLKHVKDPTPGEKKAAKDVKRGSYADRAALLKSAENDGRLKKESAPPTAKGERMVKHIKKGYADDGKLTDKEKSIAYATAWKAHNKNESIEQTGEDMRNLREGEIQQASAIVTAKTMVDRVGRWIEELSGMENDTLLQLGDSIRDEMGAEQAKTFISACAPAIQQALQNLKDTREALSTSVRQLTGEEQPAEMLGGEPGMGGDEFGGEAEPDMMNTGGDEMGPPEDELGGDEFGAADAAAGGIETAGREQRESIDRSNSLLRALAG